MSSTIKPQRCSKCEKEVITIVGKFDQWGVLVFRCADCWRIEEGSRIEFVDLPRGDIFQQYLDWYDSLFEKKEE